MRKGNYDILTPAELEGECKEPVVPSHFVSKCINVFSDVFAETVLNTARSDPARTIIGSICINSI